MFRLGLNQQPAPKGIIFFRLGDDLPADLIFTALGLDDFIHDVLPGADGGQRVAVPQIHPGDLAVEAGLALGLIFTVEQGAGFGLVLRAQADLFAGDRILGIIHPGAAEHDVVMIHNGCYES